MVVRIAAHNGSLHVDIEDNGCGFNPAASFAGEGISSIRRRIKELAGTAVWESPPGQGTRFSAVIPLRAPRFLLKPASWLGLR
jgi:two-component system sensor histidine kinase UhpB